MKTSFLAILVAAAALIEAAPQAAPPSGSSSAASASPSTAAAAGSGSAGGASGAGPVSITSPLQGTTWQIGSKETVTWQNVQQNVDKLLINLMKGDPNALQLVQTLAENVDASKGSTQVEVPKNATAGSDYSLAVGKDSSQMAYIGGLVLSSDG
ncbi:hypothetical protein CU097_002940, partial [Rhizopus azygosporus]